MKVLSVQFLLHCHLTFGLVRPQVNNDGDIEMEDAAPLAQNIFESMDDQWFVNSRRREREALVEPINQDHQAVLVIEFS